MNAEPKQCWCCGEDCIPVKNMNPEAVLVCGGCYGSLIAIEQRLTMIEKHGRLPEYLTAEGDDVPECERHFIKYD